MISVEDIENFFEGHPNNTTPNFWKNHAAPVLRLLHDCLNVKNDVATCLKPVDKVVKQVKLKFKNPNTVKFYLQALLFLVDEYPDLAEKVNRQKYYDAWQASKVVKAEFDAEEKPKKTGPSIESIQEKVDETFGKDSMESLYVSVYRKTPVRLDYQDIKVYGTMSQVPDDAEKFLVLQSKKIVMHHYNKTDKKYGTKEIKLDTELMDKIKASLKKQPRDQLFVFTNSNPTKAISNILRKAGIDKGSMNTLRHAVMSQEMTPEDRVKLSRIAGHAPTTSVDYKLKTSAE